MYDEILYRHGSYDSFLWLSEQEILRHEFADMRRYASRISYLDFACGTGRILAFAEQFADNAVGVDIADEMLERARGIVKKSELVCADITREDPLGARRFDIITAFRFFLNAEPALRQEAMAALAARLRDDKSMLIFNMHGNLWSHRIFTKIGLQLKGKHLSASTRRAMELLAERQGLRVVRWYGFGVVPKVLYRIFGSVLMYRLDIILSYVPGMRYVSYDLVFVCRKGIVEG